VLIRSLEIEVAGGFVYAGAWDGLHILDIGNPSTPVEVGLYSGGGGVYSLAVSGDHA
jgi:hypothetical protein